MQKDLYKIGKTRLNDDNDIADAIQDTMIIVFKKLKKLKDNSKFKSWVIKIFINECNKVYKKKFKKEKLLKKIALEKTENVVNTYINESNSKIDFEILIKNLSYEEKLIATLYYNNRYSYSEISNILDININTVKSKLLRAKEKVKKNYKGGIYNGR